MFNVNMKDTRMTSPEVLLKKTSGTGDVFLVFLLLNCSNLVLGFLLLIWTNKCLLGWSRSSCDLEAVLKVSEFLLNFWKPWVREDFGVLMLNRLLITFSTVPYDERHILLSTIKDIDYRLLDVTETILIKTLLFGNSSVDEHANWQILNATIQYILTAKRFDESLFDF